jgi:PKD repeat protein
MKKNLLLIGFVLLAFVQQLLAQQRFEGIPVASRSAASLTSHFTNYHLYSIPTAAIADFARTSSQLQTAFELNLPGVGTWKLELEEYNLLSEDYTLVVNGPEGKTILPKPAIKTYSGYLSDAGNSKVRLTIDDDMVYGIVKNGDHEYYIEPARYFDHLTSNDLFVVYEKRDVIIDPNLTCGATETEQRKNNVAQRLMAGTNCVRVRLAIASDHLMVDRYGSASAVQTHNIGVMNNVMWDYVNAQFNDNIEFVIVTQNVSTIVGTDQLSPAYSGTNANVILANFAAWAPGFGVTHDLGQFWTTRNLDLDGMGGSANTVGFAYIGGVGASCVNLNPRYHILEDFGGNNPTGSGFGLRVLTSHEIGHNFNCVHDNTGDPFIMAPGVSNTSNWSAASITAVNSFVSTRTCLSACSVSGVPVVNFITSPDSVICVGQSIQLIDRTLQGPSTWNWTLTDGSPSTSTDRNPTVSYATAGLKTITLSASNSMGTGASKSAGIIVSNPPATACANTGTSLSNAGVKSFQLNTIKRSSGGAADDANKYVDRTCTDITRLAPSTKYTVTVNVGDSASTTYNLINFYIDYNNDGDFEDQYEKVYSSDSIGYIGTVSFDFTTPASIPINQFLRARIIAKDFLLMPDDACHNPSAGQIEDYAVYFILSTPLPVTLLNFDGYHANGKNVLTWKTANEQNNSHFEIETSKDGRNFYQIGRVEGKNIPSSVSDYTFTDQLPATGINYYRLKQMDMDGRSTYSKIISVTVNDMQRTFTVYPNPAKNKITIDFAEPSLHTSIELFAADGKLVKKLSPGNIQRSLSVDISQFNSGVYFIQIRSDKGLQQFKFIKE